MAFSMDRLLFHMLPDIYHRRLDHRTRGLMAPRLIQQWEKALLLPGYQILEDSILAEIQEYFGLNREEALERLEKGAEEFAHHFAHQEADLQDGKALEQIYDGTDLEVFELAEWHTRAFEDGPVNYVLSLEAARSSGARTYLDYGSGIGSGAILFARHGLEVTLADVSSPMLDFACWRLQRRNLAHTRVHLRSDLLPERTWDMITLLDVLEHVADPVALVSSLRPHLTPGKGGLVIRSPFDDERPQHIPHDMRTPSRFAGLGFIYAWDRMGQHGLPIVLRTSDRWRLSTGLVSMVNVGLLGAVGRGLDALRRARQSLRKEVPANRS